MPCPRNELTGKIKTGLVQTFILGLVLLLLPLSVSGETLRGEAQVKPWSGYWWPLQKGELVRGYQGHPSPIEKYDLYVGGHYPGSATFTARNQWYDPDVPYWHGFCNGWANASILEQISIVPAAANGVYLAVGDKKGLLAAFHYQDLTLSENCRSSPAPFHRYLLEYIGENGQAVVANLDNSGEFWSYPIYKYEMVVAPGQAYDHVMCTITHADDQGLTPDFEGTIEVEKSYEYRLYKDAEGNYIGGNSGDSGEWLGASVNDHPVLVWVPIAIQSDRNFIDYEAIRAMAMTIDDELEGKELIPGHHQLIVHPDEEDIFTLEPKIGETITLQLAYDRQSPFGDEARVVLRRNGTIISDNVMGYTLQPVEIKSEAGEDRYQLSIVACTDNSSAVAIQLYADYSTANEQWFYGLPSSSSWLGFTALSSTQSSMFAQVVGDQGLPAKVGIKSAQLADGNRWVGTLDTGLRQDYFTGNKPKAVKISSTSTAVSLVFSGNDQFLWGTPQCQPLEVRKVVVPWLTHWFNKKEKGELFLANHTLRDINLTISYYYDNGSFYSQNELEFASEQIASYGGAIDYPGGASLDGWAVIEADKEGLDGAIVRTEGSDLKDQLPLLVPEVEWLVPHLAVGSGWETTVCLYNPNTEPVEVSLRCYHGEPEAEVYTITMPAFTRSKIEVVGSLWGVGNNVINSAWLQVESNLEIAGFYSYRYGEAATASMPLMVAPENDSRWLPHVVFNDSWWTGLAFVNLGAEPKSITIVALADDGSELESKAIELAGREKYIGLADYYFNQNTRDRLVALRLENGTGVAALGLYGAFGGAYRITGFNW